MTMDEGSETTTRDDVVTEDVDVQTRDEETRADEAADDAGSEASLTAGTDEGLLQRDDGEAFRARWDEIQVRFVDEPRESVERADHLVEELMQRLTSMFDEERRSLESRWDQGDDVSTEDLRVALQRYRTFFARLLAA